MPSWWGFLIAGLVVGAIVLAYWEGKWVAQRDAARGELERLMDGRR